MMQPYADVRPISKLRFRTGWVISMLPVLLLLFSAAMKLSRNEAVSKGFAELGYSMDKAIPLGILEAACALLYLFPRTSVVGAILVTGYLGGATATHFRLNQAFAGPVVLGMLAWF